LPERGATGAPQSEDCNGAPHLERKLVAILVADFEGFNWHMERDEAGTLTVLSGAEQDR
jgi:class 3 adenylate cyclase